MQKAFPYHDVTLYLTHDVAQMAFLFNYRDTVMQLVYILSEVRCFFSQGIASDGIVYSVATISVCLRNQCGLRFRKHCILREIIWCLRKAFILQLDNCMSYIGLYKPFNYCQISENMLTHWGRVMHICVCKQTTIGSDNSLAPGRRLAIIWTSAGILLTCTLGKDYETLSEIYAFSFLK